MGWLRHFGDPKMGLSYNGLKTNELETEGTQDLPRMRALGIDAWAERGVVGRGVFLDVYEWAKKSYDSFTTHCISANDLRQCARTQGVVFLGWRYSLDSDWLD
jgi:hypothetical protein